LEALSDKEEEGGGGTVQILVVLFHTTVRCMPYNEQHSNINYQTVVQDMAPRCGISGDHYEKKNSILSFYHAKLNIYQ